jgi:DNA polymerase-3 subunit epsilon
VSAKQVKERLIVVDIETTGLRCPPSHKVISQRQRTGGEVYDEILQLAIVDDTGTPLFCDNFKPVERKSWKQAQSIHGITPSAVKDKVCFAERRDEIQRVIDTSTLIVVYNATFDLGFLSAQGIELRDKRHICLMKEFARVYGAKKGHSKGYTWQALSICAQYYGIENSHTHNALSDAQTTLLCYQALVKEGKYAPRKEVWR